MGWGSASSMVSGIISAIQEAIPDESKRKEFYKNIISIFENEDWDTEEECLGSDIAFDKAMKELHPDWDLWKEEQ